jgi:hypothetical protein
VRKLILGILVLALGLVPSAYSQGIIGASPGVPVTAVDAEDLTAATGTAPFDYSLAIGTNGASAITWQTIYTGTPTSITVLLQGSTDCNTYATIDTSTSTVGEIRSVFGSFRCLRINNTAVVGGAGDLLTVKILYTTGRMAGSAGGTNIFTGGTFTSPILLSDGSISALSLAFASQPNIGIFKLGTGINFVAAGSVRWLWDGSTIFYGPSHQLCWGSFIGGNDTCITRGGVAILQQGADAASPVNQTLQSQGVAAGISDTGGSNYTINSGNGRGNATGSSLIFQTPTPVASGSGAQTMTTRLTVNSGGIQASVGAFFISGNSSSGFLLFPLLTTGTMTPETQGQLRNVTHSYAWTNAMLTAGAAATTWDVTVATLPAKTQLLDAVVVILTPQTAAGTLSVQCGDTGTFVNYTCPTGCDAKAAANTVYGDALAERGIAIDTEFWYLPSYTATTTVTCRFISNAAMSTMTASTGRVILTTRLLP